MYILLWGPNWTNTDPQFVDEFNLFHGLGVTTNDAWSTLTSQYGDGSGNPTFGGTVYASGNTFYQDTSTPPNPVTPTDLAVEAHALVSFVPITDLTNAQIVISAQSGTCYSDGFEGNCGTPQNNPNGYCAYHNYEVPDNVPFTNLPYSTDAGTDCGENFVNSGTAGTEDGVSLAAGHEYAETITDPFPNTGWIDTADTASGGEIGDKCAFSPASRDVSLSTGRFAMQPLWSNAAGGCALTTDRVTVTSPGNQSGAIGTAVSLQVHATSSTGQSVSYLALGLPPGLSMSTAGLITGKPTTAGTFVGVAIRATDAAGDASGLASFTWTIKANTVTVTSPGNQSSVIGTPVSLQILAGDSASGQTLTYKATGLPSGLSISSAGLITGKPSVTAGTFGVKVTATDTTGAHGSVSFTWAIKSGTGAIKGLASKCTDDHAGSTVNGNRIDIFTCNGLAAQKFTMLANGTLTVKGKCVRDVSGRAVLWSCGASAEQWTRHANGEYVLRVNGRCLNTPSSVNGVQLTLALCTDSTHQRWSLP